MSDLMKYEDAVAEFDPVLGLEVHVELGTETKMFDSAPNSSLGEPNTRVTPVSVGLPGSLPVANERACLLYTSPSPRDVEESRMPSSA